MFFCAARLGRGVGARGRGLKTRGAAGEGARARFKDRVAAGGGGFFGVGVAGGRFCLLGGSDIAESDITVDMQNKKCYNHINNINIFSARISPDSTRLQ